MAGSVAMAIAMQVSMGHIHRQEGKVLYTGEDSWREEVETGGVRVTGSKVEVLVAYDGSGPFASVNITLMGWEIPADGRFELGLKHDIAGDVITYKGDEGYDICCRFLHGSNCSWSSNILTPTACHTSPFKGSVKKPLPQHTKGPWTAAIAFYSAPPEITPLTTVYIPFTIDKYVHKELTDLSDAWRKRGMLLPYTEKKKKKE